MFRPIAAFTFGLAVLLLAGSGRIQGQDVLGQLGIRGAGSTFVYPALALWSRDYRIARARTVDYVIPDAGLDDPSTDARLEYEPVGSLAGMLRVRNRAVDFGITDMPMKPEELAAAGLVQFPIVIGGIAIAINVEGLGKQLRFSGPVLADIFLGRITRWSDPAIGLLNPRLRLPDAAIAVIHRSEGSGTTFNFSDYLSKVSPEWRTKVGTGLVVKWPAGRSAKGNDGVAQAVAAVRHSIGYVEASQAAQAGLSHALLQNSSGQFVPPHRAGFEANAAFADWANTSDFYRVLANGGGAGAYPLTATVFVLMPKTGTRARTLATLDFFRWILERGGGTAAQLGYAPLPPVLAGQIKAYWSRTLSYGR